MLQPVSVARKQLADYASLVGRPLVNEILALADELRGKRVLQLSATAFGGGVSELLYTIVPLMCNVGLDCEWRVIYGREEFFNATNVMHNALQGSSQNLTAEQWTTWLDYNEVNAHDLSDGWDLIIVHDPQPAAICSTVTHAGGDPDIHILNYMNNVGAVEVNAFQSHCDVAIQKSMREGLGLTVSEAIWKARPFIGGDVGGIPLQVTDGETGFLVSSVEERAGRALEVLRDPALGRRLGRRGKEVVRQRFLSPRLLRDWLVPLHKVGF